MGSPGSMASPGAKAVALNVAGAGSKGIDEMRTVLDPKEVSFGLCRVPFGTGTFAREKVILLHVNSEECSGIKRGKINGRKGDVKRLLGDVNAEVVLDDVKEVSAEAILEKLTKIIAADTTSGSGVSASQLKEQYESMLVKAAAAAASSGKPGEVALTRKTAKELGNIKADQALKAVRDPLGAFNWFLCDPDFNFVDAGSLSVPELKKNLADDQVLFGLLRMGFGSGRFRRTKWVYLCWSGPSVGPVKRGKAASARAGIKSKLGATSVDIEATSQDDLTLEGIIDKVKRATAVDGDDVKTTEGDPYSVEAFMKALEEEAAASGAFFGDSGLVVGGGGSKKTAEELIKELHSTSSSTNWVAFTVSL